MRLPGGSLSSWAGAGLCTVQLLAQHSVRAGCEQGELLWTREAWLHLACANAACLLPLRCVAAPQVLWLDCDREGENICFGAAGRRCSRGVAWPKLQHMHGNAPGVAVRQLPGARSCRAGHLSPAAACKSCDVWCVPSLYVPEVIEHTVPRMNRVAGQQVFRARFSGGDGQ